MWRKILLVENWAYTVNVSDSPPKPVNVHSMDNALKQWSECISFYQHLKKEEAKKRKKSNKQNDSGKLEQNLHCARRGLDKNIVSTTASERSSV